MSFSINTANTALSLLQSLNSSSTTPDLFSIIAGNGQSQGGDPVATLIQAETNQTKDVQQQQNDPATKNEIAHFEKVAKSAKSLQQLLSDPIAAKVFLTANGLGDQAQYTALAVKALSSDTSKTGNFASTLNNPAWVSAAKLYSFATQGLSVLQQPSSLSSIAQNYAQVQWETSLDQTAPGIAAALDFRSRASQFTNVDQILGDANVRAVVTGALGIPQQIAFQPLEAQEKAISSRLNVKDLQNPKFVENLAREYLLNNASNNASNGSSTSGSSNALLSLFT